MPFMVTILIGPGLAAVVNFVLLFSGSPEQSTWSRAVRGPEPRAKAHA